MTKYQKLVKTSRYKNSNTWLRTTHKGGGGTGREVKSWFRRMGMTSKAPTVRVKPESYRQNYVEKEISLSPVMPPPPPLEKTHIITASKKDLADARTALQDEENMREPGADRVGRISVNTKAMEDAFDASAKHIISIISSTGIAKANDDFLYALQAIVFDEKINPQNYPNYPSHANYNPYLYRLAASIKDLAHARSAVLDEEIMRHPPATIGKGRISVNTKAMNDALDARAKQLSSRRTAKDYDDFSNALHAIVFDERTNPQNYPNYPSHADYNIQLYATTASGRKYRRSRRSGKSGKSGRTGTTRRTRRGKK